MQKPQLQIVMKSNTQVVFAGEGQSVPAATCTVILLPVCAEMNVELLAVAMQNFLAEQIAMYFASLGKEN